MWCSRVALASSGVLLADGPDYLGRRGTQLLHPQPGQPRRAAAVRDCGLTVGLLGVLVSAACARVAVVCPASLVVGVLSVEVPVSALAVAPDAGRICFGVDCGIAGVTLAGSKFTVTRGLVSVGPGPMTVTIELTARKAPVLSARGRLVFSRSTVGTGQCAQKVTTAKTAHYDGHTHTLVQ